MRRLALLALALLLGHVVGSAPVASQELTTFTVVRYHRPVDAPVVDPFRPPAHIGAPGNRGLEYGNGPLVIVYSAAEGVVSFAGEVAGPGIVSVKHPDGVKTTYTGLAEMWVHSGQAVRLSEPLGLAGRDIHFGAILGDHYLDPQVLLDASAGDIRPRLIPMNGS